MGAAPRSNFMGPGAISKRVLGAMQLMSRSTLKQVCAIGAPSISKASAPIHHAGKTKEPRTLRRHQFRIPDCSWGGAARREDLAQPLGVFQKRVVLLDHFRGGRDWPDLAAHADFTKNAPSVHAGPAKSLGAKWPAVGQPARPAGRPPRTGPWPRSWSLGVTPENADRQNHVSGSTRPVCTSSKHEHTARASSGQPSQSCTKLGASRQIGQPPSPWIGFDQDGARFRSSTQFGDGRPKSFFERRGGAGW